MKKYLLRHTNYLDFFSHQSGRGVIGVAGGGMSTDIMKLDHCPQG